MARLIPKRTKVKTEFFKGLTLVDGVILLVALLMLALVLLSDFSTQIRLIVAIVVVMLVVIMMLNVAPETRTYNMLGDLFKYMFSVKKYTKQKRATRKSVNALMPYVGILEQDYDEKNKVGIIDYKEYFGVVFEIKSIEFYMLSVARQDSYIDAIDNALKALSSEQTAAIFKYSRPMVLDSYIYSEIQKKDEVLESVVNGASKYEEANPRVEIIESRINSLDAMNVDKEFPILKDHIYMAVYGKSIRQLLSTVNFMINTIEGNTNNVMTCDVLDRKQVAVFLKNSYLQMFDEREVENVDPKHYLDWAMPQEIKFKATRHVIDGKSYTTYAVADYPVTVPNAWGRAFFSVPGTRISCKFKPVSQMDAERRLDRAIMEMEVQASKRGRASTELEKMTHLETLRELMASVKQGGEVLFDTSIFCTVEEENRKIMRTQLMRTGFKYNDMFGKQRESFIDANVSRRMSLKKFERGINSSSLAAMFPFVSDAVQDEKGFYLGMNNEPVFLDFFKRDKERINSNMVVLGKSGSGKSFATKNILTHLASDNTKVFILDPEREYDILARNLNGKVVDVGSAREGRINPLQIITTLDDEDAEGQNVSLATHLQFLESFFKMILDGITNDALEVLNECIKNLYEKFGITSKTEVNELEPSDFPILQDLYEFVGEEYEKAKDDYQKNNLKIIRTYLNKFAEGGRNSMLWNGYSTITAEENFIVFNFQTLLANKNNDIANAQMLLVMRWLDNEIIKNKDYNAKYNTMRKVVVAIDEAHVFIDPKKDVALDFMFQLAKRIRKYMGMQIVITQNLKDFVGTPDIARKSTAIINASQYSLIFSLAPHDINDLVALYEKAGQINEKEQDTIVSNPRGKAFLMTGPYSRTNVDIIVNDSVRNMFEKIKDKK
ncbi:MAG: DUF87 domain-containing protein [Clostridia bacterium]|nr:DUF87 domain-containing protein [Clostridia bacterium]